MKRIGRTFIGISMAGLLAAPSAWAQFSASATTQSRDLIALQDDLTRLDASLERLTPRQKQRFDARVDELREDVIWLKVETRRSQNRGSSVSASEVSDLRQRISTLQRDIETGQGRRLASASLSVPAGTELNVRLDQSLSSATARLEDRVEASVVEPVVWNGRTVIPAGATVSGHVTDVQDADRVQRDGRLRLDFDSITLPDGARTGMQARVVSVSERHAGTSTTKKAGLGAILGGVLGGIVSGTKGAVVGAVVGAGGAVVATRGQNVELPAGSVMRLRLDTAFSEVARGR